MKLRLQVYLARAGISPSRRKAELLIKDGQIFVNKKVAKLGDKVEPGKDVVEVRGRKIEVLKKKIYIMLNKPAGCLVAKSDARGRPLAYDVLRKPSINGEKLAEDEFNSMFNVGRLDFNTEGLLLFTNDGEFGLKITHPRYRIVKVYIAKVRGQITNEAARKLEEGVVITAEQDGKLVRYKSARAKVRILGKGGKGYSMLVIKIKRGRKREIRRMCEAVGFPVIALKRIQIARLELGSLPVGNWRFLSKKDFSRLDL